MRDGTTAVSKVQQRPCTGSTQGLSPQEEHGGNGEEDSSKDRAEGKEEEAGIEENKSVRRILRIRARVQKPTQAIPVEGEVGKAQTLNAELGELRVGVDYPTSWCSRAFFAKPGSSRGLRLVTDYRILNKNISRAHHFFPSVSDIKKGISPDTKYFIKLDLTSSYHQLKIDKADRDLTTFAIGEGRYKFKRAAMGLSASSDSFCRRSDRVFQGLPVVKLVDDLLVEGRNKNNAVRKLGKVLKACRKNGVVISPKKMESGTVKFCGFQLVVKNGKPSIEADPDKCDALRKMRTPENEQEVRQFLGMCAQLAAWSPDFTHTTTHLRAPTEKDRAFVWSTESDSEFLGPEAKSGKPKESISL